MCISERSKINRVQASSRCFVYVAFMIVVRTDAFYSCITRDIYKGIYHRHNNINTHRRVSTIDLDFESDLLEDYQRERLKIKEYPMDLEVVLDRTETAKDSQKVNKKKKSRSSTMHGLVRSRKEKANVQNKVKHEMKSMYEQSDSVPISLIQVVNEIHNQPRISRSEEKMFASKAQEGLRLEKLHKNLKDKLKREPTDEEWCAAAGKINAKVLNIIVEEGVEAKNRLVTSNLRMVQSVVNLYIRNGLTGQFNAGDMMQEGMIALIRAAEKFDPDLGFRFSTYAMYGIRASVKRSQMSQSQVVHIPDRYHETFKKARTREKDLYIKFGRKCTMNELANDLNVSLHHLELTMIVMERKHFSLDAELSNSRSKDPSKKTMYDLVNMIEDNSEYRNKEQKLVRDDLLSILKRYLDPIEVQILMLRFGLLDEHDVSDTKSKPLTYKEISEITGIKTDKIRRILSRSLVQLKDVIDPEWEKQLVQYN